MSIMSHSGETLFEGTDISATSYTYSNWVNTKVDHTYVSWSVATLNASYVGLRIEGKFETYTRPFFLHEDTTSTPMTSDTLITISEKPRYIRVGFKCGDTIATPNNVYCGVGKVENR